MQSSSSPNSRGRGGGRWYPTLITLSSGKVLAVGGHPTVEEERGRHYNNNPESFSTTQGWTYLSPIGPRRNNPPELYPPFVSPAGYPWDLMYSNPLFYPRLHVLPNGMVFCSSRLLLENSGDAPSAGFADITEENNFRNSNIILNPLDGRMSAICSLPDPIYQGYGTSSILLPLLPNELPTEAYRPRVLICGGRDPQIIDLGEPRPNWRRTGPRRLSNSPQREHCNAVLLPTGEVFVCGGVSWEGKVRPPEVGVLECELYRPSPDWDDTWIVGPGAEVIRNYHSVALLMPDGRVWTAGSNRNARHSFDDDLGVQSAPTDGPNGPIDNRRLQIEIFEPWYFASDNRPRIVSSPADLPYGVEFTIGMGDSRVIASAAMIRAGSVTHAFDSDQRYVGLHILETSGETLTFSAPPTSTIAPPGYYLLFVIDKDGVPSTGRFVRLHHRAKEPVGRSIFIEFFYDLVEPGRMQPNPVIYLQTINGISEPLSQNKNEALKQLAEIRNQVTDQFKNGKMEKAAYDILYNAISKYVDTVNKTGKT
jgi:hypothetical protein